MSQASTIENWISKEIGMIPKGHFNFVLYTDFIEIQLKHTKALWQIPGLNSDRIFDDVKKSLSFAKHPDVTVGFFLSVLSFEIWTCRFTHEMVCSWAWSCRTGWIQINWEIS